MVTITIIVLVTITKPSDCRDTNSEVAGQTFTKHVPENAINPALSPAPVAPNFTTLRSVVFW